MRGDRPLTELAQKYKVAEIVVALEERRNQLETEQLLECRLNGIQVSEPSSFIERQEGRVEVDGLYPSWMIFGPGFNSVSTGQRIAKRLFDVLTSSVLLVLVLPLMACAFGQERTMPTWIGAVAHVAVDRSNGKVTVKKLYLSLDCGTVVDPDGALAQIQGSALWGLSLALHESTAFEQGQVKDTNLDTYTPLRMQDVPEVDIQFVDSHEFPVGLGEPGVISIAPAIGNAIFQAVGVRMRDLPIRPEAVLAALSAQS